MTKPLKSQRLGACGSFGSLFLYVTCARVRERYVYTEISSLSSQAPK